MPEWVRRSHERRLPTRIEGGNADVTDPRYVRDLEARIKASHEKHYGCTTWESWESVEKDWERKSRTVTWNGCREHNIASAQSS